MSNEEQSGSPLERTFGLLRHIVEGGETSNLSELARATGINRVTVMRLLADLERLGLVERVPGGGHRIGLDFLKLASTSLSGADLPEMAHRVLRPLAERLQISAYLVVPDGDHVLYLLREVPSSPLVSNIAVGSRVPAHLTTPGRVLLAQLPPGELTNLLGPEPLTTVTAQSPSTYGELEETLAHERGRGCAWSRSGFEAGIDSCAAPVLGRAGAAVAALSVAGPSGRFEVEAGLRDETEIAVVSAARDLSLLLGAT